MRDLIPWGRSRSSTREDASPILSLHREMNRLFDDAFRSFGWGSELAGRFEWPNVDVSETDTEFRVSADLPGLEEKDIDVEVQDGVVSLRGEKRAEIEDKDRRYSERFFGRFERRIALPADVDEERAKAKFKNGVLTITLPKTEPGQRRGRRIAIGRD
ncbi:MAG: Hsp20/alpha crystallin family protein [Hydrogenophilaceae bacterium]|nr:Hsp20/alpha crystallin family protein [Hydrogenophilaceae bacterium]